MYDHINVPSAPDPAREAAIRAAYLAAKAIADEHGYYYDVLSDEEKAVYQLALEQKGFDQEIALLKTKLWSMQVLFPYEFAMIERLLHLMERLCKAQTNLAKRDEKAKAEKDMDKVFGNLGFGSGLMGPKFGHSPGTA